LPIQKVYSLKTITFDAYSVAILHLFSVTLFHLLVIPFHFYHLLHIFPIIYYRDPPSLITQLPAVHKNQTINPISDYSFWLPSILVSFFHNVYQGKVL